MELTDKQTHLLARLSRKRHLYAECKGADLDALQELGLLQWFDARSSSTPLKEDPRPLFKLMGISGRIDYFWVEPVENWRDLVGPEVSASVDAIDEIEWAVNTQPFSESLRLQEGDVELRDFAFQNGQRLPVLKLHYTALGAPQRDGSGKIINAVLLLHGTGGTGKSFLMPSLADHLFQPGQPLDAERFYIVLPDGIGAGYSTKPSDGLRTHFPQFGLNDQVEAQHAMLQRIGIDHLRLVAGLSRGGMEVWVWAERFPDAMDALVPLGAMPMQISGRNLIWREIAIRTILGDPDWHGGDYDPTRPPVQWIQTAAPLFEMMTNTPERLQEAGPDRAKALAYYDRLVAQSHRDATDTLYDLRSTADYDPARALDRITAPLLAINFAGDELNPAQFSVARQTVARLPSAQLFVVPGGEPGYGHQGLVHAELWATEFGAFLRQLPGWKAPGRWQEISDIPVPTIDNPSSIGIAADCDLGQIGHVRPKKDFAPCRSDGSHPPAAVQFSQPHGSMRNSLDPRSQRLDQSPRRAMRA